MSDGTAIEWADATWNPLLGCDRVSPGCDSCYAITTANIRQGNPNQAVAAAYRGLVRHGDWTGRINLLPERLTIPLRWRKPRKIFLNSQSDLFHNDVPDEYIARVFAVMAVTPQHTYQLLTKRHGRMRSLLRSDAFYVAVLNAVGRLDRWSVLSREFDEAGMSWPLPNLWVGVSVEDQKRADLRIPALLDTPAAVRWLSCEPLLGPVDLGRWLGPVDFPPCWDEHEPSASCSRCIQPDWVVVGGESGRNARPMHPGWPRALRDQCVGADVPFFFKQWGEHRPAPVVDDPTLCTGRAVVYPDGHRSAAVIREPGPTGTMRTAVTRPLEPGDRTRAGVMLDRDTFAARVGKKAAGRELDGQVWNQFPVAERRAAPCA